jgi:DNA-binding transcriptional LysR family regulator
MNSAGEMASFVRAVELGGFSAAARSLGVTPSALSKLVTRLEARLGVRLLNRTTRQLGLTPEGHAFFLRSKRILEDIDEAESEVTRFRESPRGLLRVNVGTAFGLHQLAPAVPEFMARYPEIQLDITVTDRLVDLIEEGADVAIRTGHLADSTLIARKICDWERSICASPAYLAAHGTPKKPDDLLKHNCINVNGSPHLNRWPFEVGKRLHTVEVSGKLSANNAETILQLGEAGLGIIRLGDVIVAESVRAGRLVRLLTNVHRPEPLPLQAVYPQGRHRSPKVVAFVDFLIERFGSMPWRASSRKKAS